MAAGCTRKEGQKLDTPTTGHIRISVDECFYPLVAAELDVFHSLYKYAVVTASYVPEQQAFADLLADSARIIVATRELNDEEKKYFESIKIFPRTLKIAVDALALIVHPQSPDSTITLRQLEDLFKGENPNEKWKDLRFVFDNTSSSTARYVRETFNTELPPYCFAVNNNPEVINYVASNQNAIGIIGVNWISDGDDSTAQEFLKKVRTIRIISDSTDTRGKQPYQAYMANNTYPLTRNVYIISREARSGLGSGVSAFMASDKGQRIVLKSGLVPATMPIRIIGFSQ